MAKLTNIKTDKELTTGNVPIGVKRWSKNKKLTISIGNHIDFELTEFEAEWLTYYLTRGTRKLPVEEFHRRDVSASPKYRRLPLDDNTK